MDPLSQGLTGAVLAQSASQAKDVRYATVAGITGGMLADLDVLISSGSDPLLNLDFHRHFTHALVFIPIGGLIAAMLLWPFLRKKISFPRLYLFTFLGYATAGFLDACTSYGTHLLWPFSDERIAWNIISIIDPIYTTSLLVCVVLAMSRQRLLWARLGLVLGIVYLSFGMFQRDRAQVNLEAVAAERGDRIERSEVKPTMGNLFLWRGLYQSGDHYRVDAYRLGLVADDRFYEGESRPVFDLKRDLPGIDAQSTIATDIQRFNHFSDGYLTWVIDNPNVIGDLRYAMLPTSASPLWGIVMDVEQPMKHVSFENFRHLSSVDRQHFIAMLLGNDLPEE